MIESGEYLAFFAEATQDEVCIHAALHELDCGAFVELVVGAYGFVDRAHTAATDLTLDSIRTKTTADHRVFILDERFEYAHLGIAVNRFFQKFSSTVVLRKQRLHVTSQFGIVRAHV